MRHNLKIGRNFNKFLENVKNLSNDDNNNNLAKG